MALAEHKSIFQGGVHMIEKEGMGECSARDYAVESIAKVIVWDQKYTKTAHARVQNMP